MRSARIPHRQPIGVDGLHADLRQAGYHVVVCPGPFPPNLRCIQCDTIEYLLTDGTDLLVYDPCWLRSTQAALFAIWHRIALAHVDGLPAWRSSSRAEFQANDIR